MIYEEKIQEEIDYAIEKAKAATKEAEAKWKAAKIAWKGVRAWEEYLKKVESL